MLQRVSFHSPYWVVTLSKSWTLYTMRRYDCRAFEAQLDLLQLNLGLSGVHELPRNVLGISWTPSLSFLYFRHKHIIIDVDIKNKKHHYVHTRSYE
jgi:hypothetical protein